MGQYRYSPTRREFIAGTAGVGAAGLGVESATGKTWADHPALTDTSGTVDLVARFEPADGAGAATLKRHARTTQRPFEQFVAEQPGISIERQFWAANAALFSVDLERVSRSALLDVDGLVAVHPNGAVGTHSVADETETTELSSTQTGETDPAYHLEEMDVPQAREIYGTRGEGVDVAVLDTGIDVSGHEELAASLERGGWAEFDENGARVDSEPNAQTAYPGGGHGTSVSGIIAGGSTDAGEEYGIAPGVNLYKAKMVSQPPEGNRTLSVFAGIEWAIEQDVDILSMSLGLPQYNQAFVEPIRNAVESGLLVVSATGNSSRYASVSPANIPRVLSVGGVDDDRTIYENSNGERIDTDRYWGDTAADSWPDSYTVPDVTAPAVDMLAPVLDGEYERNTGTSFAAPCVAGVAALALAATDADTAAVRHAITETARHPAAADSFDVDPGHDDRYGRGIASAMAAISHLEASATLSGRVTDASGTPLDGATVASEAGLQTETDSQGRYELTLPPAPQPIGATSLGFETQVANIDPTNTESRTFQLAQTNALGVELTDRMATRIDTGEQATATFDVANVETVTVEIAAEGPFDPADLNLSVAGTATPFGEAVSVDPDQTQIRVAVAVPESLLLAQFRLSYEFAGGGESATGEGHLVHAHADPLVIAPSDPPTLQAPVDLVAPDTTVELTQGQGEVVAEAGDDAGLVIDKPLTLTAADGATPTIQFTNDGAENPAVALVDVNDVTISGLSVDGTGATTAIQVARDGAVPRPLANPSGVTIRDLTVSGADTAVYTGQAPALDIVDNELTAETTAISVGRQVDFRDTVTVTGRAKTTVRDNSIADVETGIDVVGQVAAVDGNTLSNIDATAIHLGTPRFLSRHWGVDIGPIRSNTITGSGRGIVVSGVLTSPIEKNDLSDIDATALVVEGAVLAAIRANRIDGAQTGLTIADGAEVTTLADNEFTNIQQPGDEAQSDETDETDTGNQDDTDETGSGEDTESATDSGSEAETSEDGDGDADSDAGGPGFGLVSALVSLGGAGYLLGRQGDDDTASRE
ncbi:S8 family serine peptidase [Halovenus halobia]|uniref:S8 family serine peptidase n=1 Tax=Halovenus halobia TaxID=3396622 RepID=UPI003F5483C7